MTCTCKVRNFASAVWAREVRPDAMVPHSKVSQTVDIFRLVCQTVYVFVCQTVYVYVYVFVRQTVFSGASTEQSTAFSLNSYWCKAHNSYYVVIGAILK